MSLSTALLILALIALSPGIRFGYYVIAQNLTNLQNKMYKVMSFIYKHFDDNQLIINQFRIIQLSALFCALNMIGGIGFSF